MARDPHWLEKMRCCLIAERAHCVGAWEATIEAALGAGIGAVQLREKQAATLELFELAQRLREMTRRHEALLLINDRADIALAVGADGVHLGWQSLPVGAVRRLVGPELLVGKSVHNLEEARRAPEEGLLDYLIASPVFDTPSKIGLVPTLGLDRLAELCRAVELPVIGLGGMDPLNAAEVLRAGAHGIAVIRAVLAAMEPGVAATRLLAAVENAR